MGVDNITIGDEYHYIIECEHFSNFRNRFIVTNLRERPNILKFKQIMSAYQKHTTVQRRHKYTYNKYRIDINIYTVYTTKTWV
jgi:DNA gyrase/topoisomerase IV subunit A